MAYHDELSAANFSMERLETAQSNRRESYLVDLRRSPRVDTQLQGVMITETDDLPGAVTNLSRSGLRFETRHVLQPEFIELGRQADPAAPTIVELKFSVPVANALEREIIVQSRLVYILGDSEAGYALGVEFRRFAVGEDALVDYLATRGV